MAELTDLLAAAVAIARGAGAILRDRLTAERTIGYKDEGFANVVTDADHASEAFILEALAREFPGHAVLAEERGAVGEGTSLWFIDPLDGTVNYSHGVPHFCVSMALEQPVGTERVLSAGVVYDPMRDELFCAARGLGATLNGRPIRVSSAPNLARGLICTGFPYDLHDSPWSPLGLFNEIVPQAQGIRRMGAAALDLAWVAAGRFDGFFEFGLKPWDTAGGALLILEAGGAMSALDGGLYSPRTPHIAAANRGIAPELFSLCARFLAGSGET
jgi:myo-inositol-1(or 4)-monophosphatase